MVVTAGYQLLEISEEEKIGMLHCIKLMAGKRREAK
jgi:hypothetical protein